MSTTQRRLLTNKGFFLVEVIIAASVFMLLVTAIAGTYLYGQESAVLSGNRTRAVMLAQEGIEAVRNIRDDSFSNLVDGAYGLDAAGGEWNLVAGQDTISIFTRQIIISTIDANRKNITVNVEWQQNAQRNGRISLATILSNWAAAVGIGDWSAPVQEASLNLSGKKNGRKIQVQGDYAYIIRDNGNPDFAVIDISDTSNPMLIGSLQLDGKPKNIAVSGNYAYVVSDARNRELQIIDVSTPSSPFIAGIYNAPGKKKALGVYAVGQTVYLSREKSNEDEFYIIDSSNPASPLLIGSLGLDDDANEVYVSGNYAYIASDSRSQELQVIDITSPSAPTLVASLDLVGKDKAETIDGSGNIVVIGRRGNNGYVHIIDISSPLSPVEIGMYSAGDDIRDIAVGDAVNYAFVVGDRNDRELQIIDISTPSSPTLIGYFDAAGDLNGVDYSEQKDRVFAVGDANREEFIVVAPQ